MTKEELIVFLELHPAYLRESLFKKHFNKEYTEILKLTFPNDFLFSQKIYHYLHNDTNLLIGKCSCGKRCSWKGFGKGYCAACSMKCSSNSYEVKEKRKNTNILIYGNPCSLHGKETEKKTRATMYERYGAYTPLGSKEIQEKYRKTCLEHLGAEHPLQSKKSMSKLEKTNLEKYGVKQVFSSKEIQQKSKTTNLKKYGVEWVFQSEEVKAKSRKTNIEKRGVPYPMQSEEVKAKSRNCCMDKYGVEHASQAESTKQHMMETNLEKHGVAWYCIHPNVKKYSNDSKPNRDFAKLLDDNGILYEREFVLETFAYDFKIENFLVEINPTITHNTLLNVFGRKPISKDYHYRKTKLALSNGYMCIHVWDWTDIGKVIDVLKNKNFEYIESHPVLHWYKTSSKSHIITEDDLSNDGYLPVYDDGNLCQI